VREIRPQTDNGTKTNGQAITRDRVEKQRVEVCVEKREREGGKCLCGVG